MTPARVRMKKRADRFLVGYLYAGNVVYGRKDRMPGLWAKPMTRRQAERALRAIFSKGAAIFELVPVASR